MSLGGKFLLTVNTGLQNKLLNADDKLVRRLNEIIASKNNIPEGQTPFSMENSVLPSLNVIEQTHNVFVNSTFKPYVTTTFEYIKTNPSGGANFGKTAIFQPSQVGNFMNDMVLHVKISGLRAQDPRDRVRYVAFPGHKLIEKVEFVINNGHKLDSYDMHDYNDHYKFVLKNDLERKKWCQNVGQEIPKQGYVTPDPTFDMLRECRLVCDGFQTLKYTHDDLEMFIPLLFWCNDVKNAIPSHIVPWGQIQIRVTFANISDIVGFADYGGGGAYVEPTFDICNLYINNLFTINEIFQIYAKKYDYQLIRVHQKHKKILTSASSGILLNNIKYPIETMFFCFRPLENLYLSQYWYKTLKLVEQSYKVPVVSKNLASVITGSVVTSTSNTAILSGGLSPTDGAYLGYNFVITGGTGYDLTDIVNNRYLVSAYVGAAKMITLSTGWTGTAPDATTTYELFTPQPAINSVTFYQEIPVVNEIWLKINDIEIWHPMPELFYNAYIPMRFGGGGMAMSDDRGSYCITFNLYPMRFQPSGSYNSSVGRELYLQYTSDLISKAFPVELIMSARAINFLIVANKTMALKYIT